MTIAFDFDGVIHKFRRGWQNGEIYDDINRDILYLIKDLLDEGHIVFILSSRSRFKIKRFFKQHKSIIPFEFETFSIFKKFWTKKGVCGICNHKAVFDVVIDDRALNFNPTHGLLKERILSFKPAVYPKEDAVSGSRFQLAYAEYWDMVKDIIDEEGWVYTKEAPHMLDAYFEGNTGKPIEFQKSFGKSGDNPHWLTRGSRWRPSELS